MIQPVGYWGGGYDYKILHTNNNGNTWNNQSLIGGEDIYKASCVYFVNNLTGWIGTGYAESSTDNGTIYHTTDGGINWNKQAEFEKPIVDVFMIDKTEGWAIGQNTIYHYNNPDFIEEHKKENYNITISPNPSNGIFTIDLKNSPFFKGEKADLTITDIAGKIIMTRGHVPLQFDLSNQPNGIYFITISNNNHKITKKLIKQ